MSFARSPPRFSVSFENPPAWQKGIATYVADMLCNTHCFNLNYNILIAYDSYLMQNPRLRMLQKLQHKSNQPPSVS
jgi:hypothetical protein